LILTYNYCHMKNIKKILIAGILLILLGYIVFNRNTNSETLKVGVVLPLSGPISFLGEDYKKGMELGAEEFGVDVVFQDGKTLPADSLNAALQLEGSGSNVIMSAFRSSTISIASNFKGKEDVLVFSTTATSDKAPIGDFGKNFFAIGAEMIANGAEAGKHAKLNCNAIAAVTENNDAGIDKIEGFIKEVGSDKVVFREDYPVDKTDFNDLITKISQYKPDCVFVGVRSNYFKTFVDRMDVLGLKPALYTTSYSVNKEVANSLTQDQGIRVFSSQTFINPSEDFSKKFYEKYKKYPNDFSIIGYEMVKLISKNSKNCGTDIMCLAEKLRKVNGVESGVGKLDIDSHQEIKLRKNNLFTIDNKEFKLVE